MDILFNKSDEYRLSAAISKAIFDIIPEIDGIMYPSMQNRFGMNLAIKKDYVDEFLEIDYSNFNVLNKAYNNVFFKY